MKKDRPQISADSLQQVTQARPSHRIDDKPDGTYLIVLPHIATDGRAPYEHNNLAHAAIYALLQALTCDLKEDALYWLRAAAEQSNRAAEALSLRRSRIVPAPKNLRQSAQSADKKSGGSAR